MEFVIDINLLIIIHDILVSPLVDVLITLLVTLLVDVLISLLVTLLVALLFSFLVGVKEQVEFIKTIVVALAKDSFIILEHGFQNDCLFGIFTYRI